MEWLPAVFLRKIDISAKSPYRFSYIDIFNRVDLYNSTTNKKHLLRRLMKNLMHLQHQLPPPALPPLLQSKCLKYSHMILTYSCEVTKAMLKDLFQQRFILKYGVDNCIELEEYILLFIYMRTNLLINKAVFFAWNHTRPITKVDGRCFRCFLPRFLSHSR